MGRKMRCRLTTGLAIAALCGLTSLAQAAPPTVTPSPGYDRRLQESRSTTSGTTAITTDTPADLHVATPPHVKHRHKH